MDRLDITGIACQCHIGVPDAERKSKQKILIDVEAETQLEGAGRSDNLDFSIDYHALEEIIRALAEEGERKLLERLAEEVADATLQFDNRITCVRIATHKSPKVMPKTERVTVRIERKR